MELPFFLPATHHQTFLFSSFLWVCLPLTSGKHSGWLLERSRLLKVSLIVVYHGVIISLPATHCQTFLFSSFLWVCLPLTSGKHSSWLLERSGLFGGSIGTFDCHHLQFFFGHFLPEKTSWTHIKTLFHCHSSFPPLTGIRGGPLVVCSVRKMLLK